MCGYDRWSIRL
jgi:hypothetical protein